MAFLAARGRAYSADWQFDVTVVRVGEQVYRLLTGAPRSSTQLDAVAQEITGSFRMMSQSEVANLRPLRVRVATVGAGDTVATMASQMVGVERKLELFRLINALGPGSTLSAGEKVKIITDR